MTNLKILSFAAVMLFAGGCASNTLRPATALNDGTPAVSRDAVVLHFASGSCAAAINPQGSETGGGGPIVAALVSMGVDMAMNAVGAAIKNQKEGRNAVWYGSNVTRFDATDAEKSGCLRVVRGNLLDGSAMNFAAHPIFEAYVDLRWKIVGAKKDKMVLLGSPYRVDYRDTSARVRGKGIKDVTLMIAISGQTLQPAMAPAAAPSSDKALGVLRLDMGRLEVAKRYDAKLLGTIQAGTTVDLVDQATLTAAVFESEGASPALEAFIAAWDSNKSDLAKALKDAIGGK